MCKTSSVSRPLAAISLRFPGQPTTTFTYNPSAKTTRRNERLMSVTDFTRFFGRVKSYVRTPDVDVIRGATIAHEDDPQNEGCAESRRLWRKHRGAACPYRQRSR